MKVALEVLSLQNEPLFRDKPVWNAILTMAVPSVFTVLIMVLYNMADMFFVGQLGGVDSAPVAAVAVVGPVFSLIMALATMIGVGGCATIAKAAGSGDTITAKNDASLCGWTATGHDRSIASYGRDRLRPRIRSSPSFAQTM